MFNLVIQDDEGKTTIVPLIRDEITIGRKEGNTIRLTERNVSRRHARISRNNGEVHIEDLGSYNGIRVNNARIAERVSLRVSDQVQIGDYKLYLKAEGLEQNDDRPASPVERTATESMPAVGSPLITAQQPVLATPVPGSMVGSPARNLGSIGGTDPDGRPVGSAATVPALNPPVGYGRLVVVSSNFVGKEFELSRPQMIIGRTEENDIVVNHRSISRNHAKVVREPETGRYTISDLQSSNGVRVNGQDYGKVELRRGDVVDLGHVRLRFVEAGEDFVFDRDAVITDVPEAGGRRGALFVVLAAIVLIGAGIAVYMTVLHGGDRNDAVAPVSGSNAGSAEGSDGVAAAGDKPPSGIEPATPPVGSDSVAAIAKPADKGDRPDKGDKPDPADRGTKVDAKPVDKTAALDDPKSKKLAECADLQGNQKWQDLRDCAGGLEQLGVKDKAKEYKDLVVKESKNELIAGDVRRLLRERNLQEAQKALGRIPPESFYHDPVHAEFGKAEQSVIAIETKKAQSFAASHDCAGLRTQARQLNTASTPRVAAAVTAIKCTDKVASSEASSPKPSGTASGSATPPAAQTQSQVSKGCENVDVDALIQQAAAQYGGGFNPSALKLMQTALACRQTVQMYRHAAMYACAAHDQAAARQFYAKVPPSLSSGILQRCQQENVDLRPQ